MNKVLESNVEDPGGAPVPLSYAAHPKENLSIRVTAAFLLGLFAGPIAILLNVFLDLIGFFEGLRAVAMELALLALAVLAFYLGRPGRTLVGRQNRIAARIGKAAALAWLLLFGSLMGIGMYYGH